MTVLLGSHFLSISKEGANGMKTAFPDDEVIYQNKTIFWDGREQNIPNFLNPQINLPYCQYFIFLKKINDKNIKMNFLFSI